ncbi:T9SS type A sorting domain-containing protein [Xanthocytophaga agilis]|uniref:T9SS type A sorting domain-containing protein n=1 Tax=Xanthocytophaga agilis TaxID=3048010 RepID=A0AAE3R701_9BACT|nr:T9SS type A sorting domain-containing protein [Xanthocytophaga agilis]MDJ1501953.1 T9SS type A sorting domain-containing protein [Xanthocytophaga agilis]
MKINYFSLLYRRVQLIVLFLGILSVSDIQAQISDHHYGNKRIKAEDLDRGVVAVRYDTSKVFISWRLLTSDPEQSGFDVYRITDHWRVAKLNRKLLKTVTYWIDSTADLTRDNTYYIQPAYYGWYFPIGYGVKDGNAFTLEANTSIRQYLSVPLAVPSGGTTPDNVAYTYNANDASVGDLDGDGEYEIILKWDPSNAKDNSQSGFTGNVYLDAYKLDGRQLWRIDLGRNIRAGAHYTQFMVYDLDGDGRAEIACKTADGTIDGRGKAIGDTTKDWRNPYGYILSGPEYLTVFDGRTGAALSTVQYVPQRHPVAGDNPTPDEMRAVWGDNYGNRIDRFLACVAYLDGKRPSLVMCRGYYTRTVLVAWDFKNKKLTQRWLFDSDDSTGTYLSYRGQGNHNLTVGDIDEDGKDEIVYGSCAIDDNGKGMYTTGRGHGDALHMSDMDPSRPGLEVFSPHESPSSYGNYPLDFREARTGTLIWGGPGPNQGDVGRGIAIDIDPRYLGYEAWATRGGLYSAKGVQISATRPSQINFAAWWDGDLLRELLDGTSISKWNYVAGTSNLLLNAFSVGAASNNGTKATPCLSADLFGDWREEIIWRNANNQELLIFTTTIPTPYRMPTLMQDRQYRLSIAWQNVAYNQPPHPGFYLGTDSTGSVSSARISPDLTPAEDWAEVSVGPNPSVDGFEIQVGKGVFHYQIYESSGRLVDSGTGKDHLTVGKKLTAGAYIIKISSGDHSKVVKVVKQ